MSELKVTFGKLTRINGLWSIPVTFDRGNHSVTMVAEHVRKDRVSWSFVKRYTSALKHLLWLEYGEDWAKFWPCDERLAQVTFDELARITGG